MSIAKQEQADEEMFFFLHHSKNIKSFSFEPCSESVFFYFVITNGLYGNGGTPK